MATLFACAAQAAPVLRVLAWPGYADPDIVKRFEERHKVKVQVSIVSSDESLWERVNANGGGDVDVFAVNTAELKRYVDGGLVVPLNLGNIPNAQAQLPRFRNLAAIPNLTHQGRVYALPYTYSEMGLIYDRKQVATPPTSISALWDPRYRGKVLAFDTGSHNFSIAALALGRPNPFQIDDASYDEVVRHLVALRRNVLTFYSLPEEAVELFVGQHVALLFANYGTQQVQQLRKAGADIGYVIPQEGALAWLDCWTITRGARDKVLAEAWINHMLERSVGEALTERQGLANTVVAPAGEDRNSKILWLEPVENAERRTALWTRIMSGARPETLVNGKR
ncbi:extracellular solute-binding protein [Ideonella sp. BN130291]|uniref:extracellular solute-binding protein n=1 Tax=Ideonella sp. BN130291 TaxID=3112940 RepID=UPI002E25B6EE|nr:extracellular solute-binding protein [Ideonella sp. BN130291]